MWSCGTSFTPLLGQKVSMPGRGRVEVAAVVVVGRGEMAPGGGEGEWLNRDTEEMWSRSGRWA
jgi:hypothetical protein